MFIDQEDLHSFLICLLHLRPEQSLKLVPTVIARWCLDLWFSPFTEYLLLVCTRPYGQSSEQDKGPVLLGIT